MKTKSHSQENQQNQDSGEIKLVGEAAMVQAIWPDKKTRPSHRTLINWRNSGMIPFVRMGGRVFYHVPDVRQAIGDKWTVNAKRKAQIAKANVDKPEGR